jgi:hypothetical protein
MANKLFALRNEQGYALRKSTREEGIVTNYEDISKGLTYAELIGVIVHLPDEFYTTDEDVAINFSNKDSTIRLSTIEKMDLERTVREHQKRIKASISNK